ncbi:sulfatase-like hydrolase/transferase [Candidatus Poribacteria bacterium]|nr:sulfatase-like hydrolase/transferase [Candidatus Poribacteria bacterium]
MPSGIDFSRPVHSGHAVGFTYDFLHLDWNAAGPELARSYPGGNGSTLLPEMQDCARWYFENGMSEGGDPDFLAFDMREAQLRFGERCVEYIDAKGDATGRGAAGSRLNQRDDAPFFLYYAPPMPHTPVVPADRFLGMSGAGLYGDFVCEFDWIIGRIVNALERNDLLDDTMIIVSSDNGPENTCYPRIREFGHASMGPFRGVKRDMWETGHRMPFIVSWPGVVEPGATCNAVVGQTDLLATFSDMLGASLPEGAGEDSVSILPLLRGERDRVRDSIVYHANEGPLAIRRGDWVLMEEPSVVSWQLEPDWFREERGIVSPEPGPQLFDLAEDPYQRHNLFDRRPATVEELRALLAEHVAAGRSVDG